LPFVVDPVQRHFPLKWILVVAQCLTMIGTLLLTFGDTPQKYWSFVFPGLIIGTAGISPAYIGVKYGYLL
jgi:nitrate/nitrite transporter NarK